MTATINRDRSSSGGGYGGWDHGVGNGANGGGSLGGGGGYSVPSPYENSTLPNHLDVCGNVGSLYGSGWHDCDGALPTYPEAPETAPTTTLPEPITGPQEFEIDGVPHWFV